MTQSSRVKAVEYRHKIAMSLGFRIYCNKVFGARAMDVCLVFVSTLSKQEL